MGGVSGTDVDLGCGHSSMIVPVMFFETNITIKLFLQSPPTDLCRTLPVSQTLHILLSLGNVYVLMRASTPHSVWLLAVLTRPGLNLFPTI